MSRALLIFARRPLPGRVKTRLTPFLSPEDAAALYDCMVRDLVARSAELDADERFLFFEKEQGAEEYFRDLDGRLRLLPQEGDGLGERLANAFAEVFGRGYLSAAVVGTDSPDLPLQYIGDAFERLATGEADVVFGPAVDGGYYLAAMNRSLPELFREVPWSTDQVLVTSLRRAAAEGLRAGLLPQWYDIDEPADLARPELLDEGSGAGLTRSFLARLSVAKQGTVSIRSLQPRTERNSRPKDAPTRGIAIPGGIWYTDSGSGT